MLEKVSYYFPLLNSSGIPEFAGVFLKDTQSLFQINRFGVFKMTVIQSSFLLHFDKEIEAKGENSSWPNFSKFFPTG